MECLDDMVDDLIRKHEKRSLRFERSSRKKYNIGVIGLGNNLSVGTNIAYAVSSSIHLNELFVCSKGSSIDDNKNDSFSAEQLAKNLTPDVKHHVCKYDNIQNWIHDVDIAVIATGRRNKDRTKELEENFEIFKELAPRFEGYEGMSVIFSNPSDTMAYAWSVLTQCNPYSVCAFSHVDTARMIALLKERKVPLKINEKFRNYFNLNISNEDECILTMGVHNYIKGDGFNEEIHGMIPFMQFVGFKGEIIDIFEDDYDSLKRAIPFYAFDQYKDNRPVISLKNKDLLKNPTNLTPEDFYKKSLRTASPFTGNVFSKYILSAINNRKPVSMSVYKDGIYITYPSIMRDGKAIPLDIDITECIQEKDYNKAVQKIAYPLIDKLRELGLKGEPAKAEETLGNLKKKLRRKAEEDLIPLLDDENYARKRKIRKIIGRFNGGHSTHVTLDRNYEIYGISSVHAGSVKAVGRYNTETGSVDYFEFDFSKFGDVNSSDFESIIVNEEGVHSVFSITRTHSSPRRSSGIVSWNFNGIAQKDIEIPGIIDLTYKNGIFLILNDKNEILEFDGENLSKKRFKYEVEGIEYSDELFGFKDNGIYTLYPFVNLKKLDFKPINSFLYGDVVSFEGNNSFELLKNRELAKINSFNGRFDLKYDDGYLLAFAKNDDSRIWVRRYETFSDIVSSNYETVLHPDSKSPAFNGYSGIQLSGDYLFLYKGNNVEIHNYNHHSVPIKTNLEGVELFSGLGFVI